MQIRLLDFRRAGRDLRLPLSLLGVTLVLILALSRIPAAALAASVQTSTGFGNLPVVIVDAGHGGVDCGCVGANGTYEKDLCLTYANTLSETLSAKEYRPIMTRTEDKLVLMEGEDVKGLRKTADLKNRAAMASAYENAMMISVHMNSFSDPSVSGLTVYHAADDASCALAKCIRDAVVKDVEPDNKRALKTGDNIYILKNATCPAVLIEFGFLSCPEECEKLLQKEVRERLCFAVVCGMMEYEKNKAGT